MIEAIIFVVGFVIRFLAIANNPYFTLHIQKPGELITTGAYGVVRHPGYVGSFLMGSAIGLFFGGLGASILPIMILAAFLSHRADIEEDMLSVEFPEYAEYKTKVGKFFPKLF